MNNSKAQGHDQRPKEQKNFEPQNSSSNHEFLPHPLPGALVMHEVDATVQKIKASPISNAPIISNSAPAPLACPRQPSVPDRVQTREEQGVWLPGATTLLARSRIDASALDLRQRRICG